MSPFVRKDNEPPSHCLGKSEYAWATGFKTVKVLPSGDSVGVEGTIGQSSKDVLAIDHWCPFHTPPPSRCIPQDSQGVGLCAMFLGYKWDGENCVTVGGCSCEGSDCDSPFESIEACQEAFHTCICQEQDAQGVGPCDQFFGYKWDGEQCVGVSGCSCEGSDCKDLFDSPTECQEAFLACACQEQDAIGVGLCEAILGVQWDGKQCVTLSGCSCEGRDCDSLFASPEECRDAFLLCGSSEQKADEHKQAPRADE